VYLAHDKGGICANDIDNVPAFQRTPDKGLELERVGKVGKK